jgi:hypothetical protein
MIDSEIYTNFSDEIEWIREKIREDTITVPNLLQSLSEFYVKKRLMILPSDQALKIKFDPEIGRPAPYAVFWFAEAFDLEKEITKRLALGLVYSSIAITINDDIVDHEPSQLLQYLYLANKYLEKYLEIFYDLFDPDSKFWYYLASSFKELARYRSWNLSVKDIKSYEPFSEAFLRESSRYFSAVVMPSIVATATATDNEEKIPLVLDFLKNFCMGWRIYDDLNDWRADLEVKNLNHSSTLIYASQKMGKFSDLDQKTMSSMFLDTNFIKKAYDAMLSFFRAAQKDVSALNCDYLSKFMEEQINFNTRRRDSLLSISTDYYNTLDTILKK